jgi:hypothetical protein
MKIEDPLDFLTTPCTPSIEFENECASMAAREKDRQSIGKVRLGLDSLG